MKRIITQKNGRYNWKRFFKYAQIGDTFDLPTSITSSIHGHAATYGASVRLKTNLKKKLINVEIIDCDSRLKDSILEKMSKLPLKKLNAIFDACKKNGLLN